jgi:hypothetical protein
MPLPSGARKRALLPGVQSVTAYDPSWNALVH